MFHLIWCKTHFARNLVVVGTWCGSLLSLYSAFSVICLNPVMRNQPEFRHESVYSNSCESELKKKSANWTKFYCRFNPLADSMKTLPSQAKHHKLCIPDILFGSKAFQTVATVFATFLHRRCIAAMPSALWKPSNAYLKAISTVLRRKNVWLLTIVLQVLYQQELIRPTRRNT